MQFNFAAVCFIVCTTIMVFTLIRGEFQIIERRHLNQEFAEKADWLIAELDKR